MTGLEEARSPADELGAALFDPSSRVDPYPVFHRLREEAPFFRGPDGTWVLSRYADISTVLCDQRFGYREPRALRTRALLVEQDRDGLLTDRASGRSVSSFMTQNPPQHTRLRRLVAPAFTGRAVTRLRRRVVEHADALLDDIVAAGEVDLVETFAYPLPFRIICELLGVPPEDRAPFPEWSHAIALGMDPDFLLSQEEVARRARAMLDAAAYFHELAKRRRRHPREDLVSVLVQADGGALSSAEVSSTCIMFLVAGHESTASLIALGSHALLTHPGQLDLLYSDPSLTANAVEEFLRYDTPGQTVVRTALTDTTIGEEPVPAGTKLMSLLGAANRDPAVFPDPDRFDLTRSGIRHLGFSQGTHFCLGAALARLEMSVAVRRLIDRTRSLEPAGPARWRGNFSLRGLAKLPTVLA
ncbi:cytochrome P450 [Amycolatopsis oliviviridis]|uniref:Cytochrome P450 n=1 Tax=Amycolatopsis oliviviridis TaxID=1471590 RepID=A0ABQ3MDA4_9PSEU|nr:cytochrome P450 [Amycolatopsis oliviviridis]GHH37796.1 cytochrome P450 [Amycolatopsis oliviviridis]